MTETERNALYAQAKKMVIDLIRPLNLGEVETKFPKWRTSLVSYVDALKHLARNCTNLEDVWVRDNVEMNEALQVHAMNKVYDKLLELNLDAPGKKEGDAKPIAGNPYFKYLKWLNDNRQ